MLAAVGFIIGQLWKDPHKGMQWQSENMPVVIWWTPLMNDYTENRVCDKYFCKFTTNRKEQDKAKVILNMEKQSLY